MLYRLYSVKQNLLSIKIDIKLDKNVYNFTLNSDVIKFEINGPSS